MNWFDHEYLVPIILGNGKEERTLSRVIRRATGAIPDIFADKFGTFQCFSVSCHRLPSENESIIYMSICSFLDYLEEYRFPVIIYGEEFKDFVISNSDSIEEKAILCTIDEAYKMLNGDI